MRKASNRVRITGQLIDAATGAHLWADRFDGDLTDVFDMQDRVTASVAGAIEPRLQRAEIERAQSKPTQDLGAYDDFLRGVASFHQMCASRCSVPGCDGANSSLTSQEEEALWQAFFTAAPARRREFEPSSKRRKRRPGSSPVNTALTSKPS